MLFGNCRIGDEVTFPHPRPFQLLLRLTLLPESLPATYEALSDASEALLGSKPEGDNVL